MTTDKQNTIFVIDFDSTFVTIETLEKLASYALRNKSDTEKKLAEMKAITAAGMRGDIPFSESLSRRLKLFKTNKTDIRLFAQELQKYITPSILKNKQFITEHKDSIYIISGGFHDYMTPVTEEFNLEQDHVIANHFVYDQEGTVIDADQNIPLTKAGGKIQSIKNLGLQGKIYVVGDGYTDYEIKAAGLATKFFAFCENVTRDTVTKHADHIVNTFDEVLTLVNCN